MSYDIYCYKSKLGKPDEDEADSVIAADSDKWAKKDRNPALKLAIVENNIIIRPPNNMQNRPLVNTDIRPGNNIQIRPAGNILY